MVGMVEKLDGGKWIGLWIGDWIEDWIALHQGGMTCLVPPASWFVVHRSFPRPILPRYQLTLTSV